MVTRTFSVDDRTGGFDLLWCDDGVRDDLIEGVNGQRYVLVKNIDLVDRLSSACGSIPTAAMILYQPRKLRLTMFRCAHEQEVLQEVGRFPLVAVKISLAYVDDQTNGHIVGVGPLLQHDIEAGA